MVNDLYVSFFGFRERPFTLLPDPDFLFWSRNHKRAYAILEYGFASRAPLTVVTGEIGAGKTTLVQKLLGTLGENVTVGLISNAQGNRGDLLRWVLYALEVPADMSADYVNLFKTFQDFVINEYAAGRYVVLVIDEAQNLSIEALEELRLLTNINSNKDELLQLILVGQPELRDIIAHPALRQFAQRVTATCHLGALDLTSTQAYIRHRLQHVGGTGMEISAYAMRCIYDESEGVPRIINKLCDIALLYAAIAEERIVGIKIMRELLADNFFVKTKVEQAVYVLTNPVQLKHSGAAE